jgi:hypothetical protein
MQVATSTVWAFATVEALVAMAEKLFTNRNQDIYKMSHGRHVHYGWQSPRPWGRSCLPCCRAYTPHTRCAIYQQYYVQKLLAIFVLCIKYGHNTDYSICDSTVQYSTEQQNWRMVFWTHLVILVQQSWLWLAQLASQLFVHVIYMHMARYYM